MSIPNETSRPFPIRSIVLADDDEDDILLFKHILLELDSSINLQVVPNGIKALSLLHDYLPDILFLDIDMPLKNGMECLIEIRMNAKLPDLPIVICSAVKREASVQAAYELGAHLFLTKTPDPEEYRAYIEAILNLDWKNPQYIKQQYFLNGRYASFNEKYMTNR